MTESVFRSADRSGPSLLWVLNQLLRYRARIVASGLGLALFLVLIALLRARTYTVSTSFMPQARKAASGMSALAAQFGIALPAADAQQSPAFYADLIQTREVLEALIDTTFVLSGQSRNAGGRVTLAQIYGIRVDDAARRDDKVLRRLRKDVTGSVQQRTGVLTAAVTSPDPRLSLEMSRVLLQQLDRFNLERRQSQAAAERQFTEDRLQDARTELRTAEDRLAAFLQRNRDYRNSAELTFQQDRLQREVSLRQQLYGALAQSLEEVRIEEVRDTPVITVVERPILPVRPDPRGIVRRALGGFMVGVLLAGVWVVFTGLLMFGERDGDDLSEFQQLRANAMQDVRHPVRAVRRALRRSVEQPV